jgi:formate dehydrogenase major subunit
VQDIFLTETAEFADVVLPATSFLEKDGTYTNTDRRVQIGRKALDAPGQARPDWEIIREISARIGLPMEYESVSDVFDEMVALSPAYAGLAYGNLEPVGKLYPNPDPEQSDGTVVLFTETFATDDGKAHLVPAEWMPAKELPNDEYPFVLNTGRLLEHWHTGSMTRRAGVLDAIEPVGIAAMNPRDMQKRGLRQGDKITVETRRGALEAILRPDREVAEGMIFMPFCFAESPANRLTNPKLDPFGKIPEFKYCAARVERAAETATVATA